MICFRCCRPVRKSNDVQSASQNCYGTFRMESNSTDQYESQSQFKSEKPKQSFIKRCITKTRNYFHKETKIKPTWGYSQIALGGLSVEQINKFKTSYSDDEIAQYDQYALNLKKAYEKSGDVVPDNLLEEVETCYIGGYEVQEVKAMDKIINKFKNDRETKLDDLSVNELKTLMSLVNKYNFTVDIKILYKVDYFNQNFKDCFYRPLGGTLMNSLSREEINSNLSKIILRKLKFNLKELNPQAKTALENFSVNKIGEKLKDLEFTKTQEQSSIFKLKYTFEELQGEVDTILVNSGIDNDKKAQILNQLQNTPQSILFNEPTDAFNDLSNETLGEINEKINKYLSPDNVKFSNDTEMPEEIKEIFKAIPALITTIGRNQAGHSFTVDTHIIAVAKAVVENDKFEGLNDKDKKLVLLASLMHDITKMEGGQDPVHPITSAKYAYKMLKKAGFEDESCKTVMNLIYCHHFGEVFSDENKNKNEKDTLAYECSTAKSENFMNMLQILGEADIYGNLNINQDYAKNCKEAIEQLSDKKEKIIETLNKLKTQLALTPFPKLSEYVQNEQNMAEVEGVNVINLSNSQNLSDIKLLVHAVGNKESILGIENLTSEYKSDAILSTSDITLDNVKLYEGFECGFIMDSENTSILKKYDQNASTGVKKTRDMIGMFINQKDGDRPQSTIKINSEVLVTDFNVSAIFMTEKQFNAYKNGNQEETSKELAQKEISEELIQFAKKHNFPLVVIPNSNIPESK